MRRYPLSTIYRYLDRPSTQRIQTHNSHSYNTTPPLQKLVQTTYPLPTYTTHTTAIQTQTHVQHFHFSVRIGKTQTQSSHPLTPSPPTSPRDKHMHISHTPLIPRTTRIHSRSAELDTILEPRVPPTCPALTTTTPHPFPTLALPSTSHHHTISAYTHATQTTVHASQSQSPQPPYPHRVPRQPHKQTKDGNMTTDTVQLH